MTEARQEQSRRGNSSAWSIPQVPVGNPLFAVVTDINVRLIEGAAKAQKDWAAFVHRRVKEDISASQQLMNCRSLTDMQQIYSQYLRTAFEQYREHSEKAVRSGKSMTEELVQTMELRTTETARSSN